MEALLDKAVNVPATEIFKLEGLLASNGFAYCTVWVDDNHGVHIRFPNEEEYTVFILKGILDKLDRSGYYIVEPDFAFMRRLEKKLKTFSACDEYIIRRVMKDT